MVVFTILVDLFLSTPHTGIVSSAEKKNNKDISGASNRLHVVTAGPAFLTAANQRLTAGTLKLLQ